MEPCSSVLIERAALRIQKTIQTSTTTATAPTAASNSSWAFCGKEALASCRPAPTNSDSAMARKTPTQTAGSQAGAAGLRQVGGDDAGDEGGFQPLTQHDQKRSDHPFGSFSATVRHADTGEGGGWRTRQSLRQPAKSLTRSTKRT